MSRSAALAAALFAAAAPAVAQTPADLAATFDNTLVSTYADGRSAKLWLDADGRYTGEGRRGDASGGRWSVKGEKLCFKQSRPLPVLFAYCAPMVEGGVGTIWRTKSVFGEPITVELVRGR
ncbi:MAG TPA: hypothetical protein VL460_10500 [Caulobacteraceae bacterium]|jgi:hypothetical protein|nr:hypothetical protein [Caulobacteraceae bacterium]